MATCAGPALLLWVDQIYRHDNTYTDGANLSHIGIDRLISSLYEALYSFLLRSVLCLPKEKRSTLRTTVYNKGMCTNSAGTKMQ